MHTWYFPAGTFAANSRAGFRVPDATLASVPFCSTFTGLPDDAQAVVALLGPP